MERKQPLRWVNLKSGKIGLQDGMHITNLKKLDGTYTVSHCVDLFAKLANILGANEEVRKFSNSNLSALVRSRIMMMPVVPKKKSPVLTKRFQARAWWSKSCFGSDHLSILQRILHFRCLHYHSYDTLKKLVKIRSLLILNDWSHVEWIKYAFSIDNNLFLIFLFVILINKILF